MRDARAAQLGFVTTGIPPSQINEAKRLLAGHMVAVMCGVAGITVKSEVYVNR